MSITLVDTLAVGNELGEGVIWDHQNAKIWWTDIEQSQLYRYDPESKELESWNTPERLCCFATRENAEGLVAAFESGFAFYQPETGRIEWIKKLEQDNPVSRFNDGRTDRQGRLWSGTMIEGKGAPYLGSLYCLNHDLTVTKHFGSLTIPNSLCWSPDGRTMYHTDTPSLEIKRYEFDTASGHIGEPSLFTKTLANCFPDGSTIDADGYLWNAQWGGRKIVRYTPDGSVDLEHLVPTEQPSCMAFGGAALDLLIITSAHQGMTPEARAADSQAGNLFIYQTQFRGLPERGFVHRN